MTVKQQRDARRQEKVAALKREQARSKRNRTIGIVTASVAGAAAIALIVTVVVTSGTPRADRGDIDVAGVQTWDDLTANHVQGTVDYEMTPPAGGDHAAVWMNCGVYTEPVPNENAVHDLEHGAIWFTYDPAQVTDEQIEQITDLAPSTYSVVSPYEGMDSPMAVSAWGAQLAFDDPEDDAVSDFVTKYWKSSDAPEPGAPCTNGVDGPGKVS
nr:DUF3105 domain-containing protein [Frigoribacterium faeni]